jgi:PAS domain S-box-containing protein
MTNEWEKPDTDGKSELFSEASSNEILNALLASIGEAVIIVDPSGRTIVNCNDAAEYVFGYPKEELIGQPTRIIHIDDQHYRKFGEISEPILDKGEVFRTEFRMQRKDGTIIDTYNTVTPVLDELGWEAGVVSVVRDISDTKEYERQLEKNLDEKETLIKEIHHRVKNNLNVVISLLELQQDEIATADDAVLAFDNTRQRIFSMALVHEKLYQSDDLTEINLSEYIQSMARHLTNALDVESRIELSLDVDDIQMNINYAIPCGLIINELFTNALKHAFPDHRSGHVKIDMHQNGPQTYQLKISDNGIGMPDPQKFENPNTLGLQIFLTLVDQLKGEWSVDTEEGTHFTIEFTVS